MRTERIAQNGSTRSKQYRSLTREDWGSSGPAIPRTGDTKEPWRNFFSPSQPRSAGTAPPGPCIRERLSSLAGASARPRFAAPSGAVAGAISKSFQEVSGPLQPASCLLAVFPAAAPPPLVPALPPRSPAAPAPFVWLRRAGLRRVELSPWRFALLRAAGLAAVAKRPEP